MEIIFDNSDNRLPVNISCIIKKSVKFTNVKPLYNLKKVVHLNCIGVIFYVGFCGGSSVLVITFNPVFFCAHYVVVGLYVLGGPSVVQEPSFPATRIKLPDQQADSGPQYSFVA